MKKTDIYYTEILETESISGVDKLTGIKTVLIYQIVKNKADRLGQVTCLLSDYSRNMVVVFLHQNHINFNEITLL
jgi:hypothetical protein